VRRSPLEGLSRIYAQSAEDQPNPAHSFYGQQRTIANRRRRGNNTGAEQKRPNPKQQCLRRFSAAGYYRTSLNSKVPAHSKWLHPHQPRQH